HLFMYAANTVLGLEAGTDSAMVAREASPTSCSGWSRRAWDVLRNDIALNLREGSLEKLVVIHEGSRRTILGTFDSGPLAELIYDLAALRGTASSPTSMEAATRCARAYADMNV